MFSRKNEKCHILFQIKTIEGITTKGRNTATSAEQYVTKYQIRYIRDIANPSFVPILDRFGNVKNFIGNSDNDTPVTHILEQPIQATFISVFPVEFNGYPCMRLAFETNCDPVCRRLLVSGKTN